MFKICKNKPKHLCPAYRCKNLKGGKKRFCPKHDARYQKYTNPVSYFYYKLKSNANRRGKVFKLTKSDFKEFCEQTGYLELKGKKKTSASIDRIDPAKGYEVGNIQVLTLSENSKKRHEDDKNCPF